MKLDFKKVESSRANKVFLLARYMSGDADAFSYEEDYIEELSGDNLIISAKDQLDIIQDKITPYKILKNILDINHPDYMEDDSEIESKYGNEVFSLYENVPYDVTCSEYKQALCDLFVVAYSSNGTKYKSYIF